MAHISEPRVLETTTTTGTGDLTLAGAVTGHRTFASVCATSDTCLYYIEAVDANGVPSGDWECGLGTYSASNTLTRTTPVRSSNANAAVNFGAGTKRVAITLLGNDVHVVTPNTNQNDYDAGSLADLINCNNLRLNIGATIKLTGLAATYDGHEIVLANSSSDYLLWLEHQNTASSAANRFDLPNGFPFFMMPGDRITLRYSTLSNRWQAISASANISQMGLTEFTDFASGQTGPFTSTVSGTGASQQASTYLVNTTERVMGAAQIDTGTTTTGRATVGYSSTAAIVPTLGPALSVVRLAIETAVTGTETFTVNSGFIDSAGGTRTDGVIWEYWWTGSAAEWSQTRFAAAAATRTNTGSPSTSTNYIWLVVFVNPGWTRADFIYSDDSVSFTLASSPTTGFPSNTQYTGWAAASMIKSAGTTQRNCSIDLAGIRVDYVRG